MHIFLKIVMVPKRVVKIKEQVPEDAEVSCQGIKRKSSADQLVAYSTPKKKEKPSELEQVVLAGSPRPSTGSQMTLAAIFEKAGSPCKIVTTLSPGAKQSSDIARCPLSSCRGEANSYRHSCSCG